MTHSVHVLRAPKPGPPQRPERAGHDSAAAPRASLGNGGTVGRTRWWVHGGMLGRGRLFSGEDVTVAVGVDAHATGFRNGPIHSAGVPLPPEATAHHPRHQSCLAHALSVTASCPLGVAATRHHLRYRHRLVPAAAAGASARPAHRPPVASRSGGRRIAPGRATPLRPIPSGPGAAPLHPGAPAPIGRPAGHRPGALLPPTPTFSGSVRGREHLVGTAAGGHAFRTDVRVRCAPLATDMGVCARTPHPAGGPQRAVRIDATHRALRAGAVAVAVVRGTAAGHASARQPGASRALHARHAGHGRGCARRGRQRSRRTAAHVRVASGVGRVHERIGGAVVATPSYRLHVCTGRHRARGGARRPAGSVGAAQWLARLHHRAVHGAVPEQRPAGY
eukprot:ctg_2848.g458